MVVWIYGGLLLLCKSLKKDGWLGVTQNMKNDYKLLLLEVLPTASLSSLICHNHSMFTATMTAKYKPNIDCGYIDQNSGKPYYFEAVEAQIL